MALEYLKEAKSLYNLKAINILIYINVKQKCNKKVNKIVGRLVFACLI